MKLLATKKVEENVYELEIRVEAEEFKAACEKSYKKNASKLNIPGFRKGKAPKAMVLKMVGEEYFFDDAINDTYPAAYEAALEESKLEPVDRANVELEEVTADGYTFKATVTVRPEVKLEGYKGLSAHKDAVEVTDEEVEAELSRMADRNSRMIAVEDRAAQDGDTAVIDFEGFVDGKAFEGGKGENYSLTLGSGQFIPGFEEQVCGHKPNEEFEVNVTFPEEYHAEDLKGKAAVFKVKLHELKKKELPAIDDEFAKDVSEFDTLDELKADLKAKALEFKTRQAEERFENELVEAAAAKVEAVIPQVMFDRKIDDMIQDFDYRLQSQGLNLKDYLKYTGTEMEDFRKSFAPRAEMQVKSTLALQKIAELENIQVSDEEVEAEYKKAAEAYNIEVDKVKTFISRDSIVSSLTLNKAIDLLKETAVIAESAAEEKAAPKTAKKKAAKAEKGETAEAGEGAPKKATRTRKKKTEEAAE